MVSSRFAARLPRVCAAFARAGLGLGILALGIPALGILVGNSAGAAVPLAPLSPGRSSTASPRPKAPPSSRGSLVGR